MPCNTSGGGVCCRSLNQSEYENFFPVESAVVFTAGMAVSGGVDHTVSVDGACILSGTDLGCIQTGYPACHAFVRSPAGGQFLLVTHFFQSGELFVCICMAVVAVGSCPAYDLAVFEMLKDSSISDDSLYSMDHFCGISELYDLYIE